MSDNRRIVNKTTTEKFQISLIYRASILPAGATILTATVASIPTGLTLTGDPVIDGNEVLQMIQGGTSGTEYTVTFTITTSEGATWVRSILVRMS